jgi:cysteine desulfurase
MIYLDWNATTKALPEVVAAMALAASDAWANPSSVHGLGRKARHGVERARGLVAGLFAADSRDVVLTSGGTEANNLAIRSAFAEGKGTLLTSHLEHPSVTRVAEALEREGTARVRWLNVLDDGTVDLEDVAIALRGASDVRLVTVQSVNHETGVIQPVEEVAALAHARGALVHVDAVQAVSKVDLLPCSGDTIAIAAHKFRGPKGIGALVHRPGVRLVALMAGGSQERGVRPGTVDPVAAAGMAAALDWASIAGREHYAALEAERDALEAALLAMADGALQNGTAKRAPHVSNLYFPRALGPELVAALDLEGVCVSSGSACSAGTSEPSPVLTAMVGVQRAMASVRLSLGEALASEARARVERAFAAVLMRL